MPQASNQNHGEVARVALDLWRAFYGNATLYVPTNDPATAQKALLFYAECLKAVSDEEFNVEDALK
jgi:hypothetical protein